MKERVGLTDTHWASRTRVTSGSEARPQPGVVRDGKAEEGRARGNKAEPSRCSRSVDIKNIKRDAPPRKTQQEDKKFQKNESCDANKKHFYRVSV